MSRRLESEVKVNKVYWMQALYVILPLPQSCMNENMMEAQAELVRLVSDYSKAILLKVPTDYKHFLADTKAITIDYNYAFGKHENRGITLKGHYKERTTRPNIEQFKKFVYVLLEGIERDVRGRVAQET